MQTRRLGKTGLQVSEIGLGAEWLERHDAQEVKEVIDACEAEAQAEILIAEGEAEYMNILSDAYSDPAKADFYSFVRALDAAKASLAGGGNTLFLSKDSPLAQIFYSGQ